MKGLFMQLRMKVIRGKPKGHFLLFPPGEFLFGRGPECNVRPNSDLISRQHCMLQITEDDVKVRDLGSMNGTLVNGQLVVGERKLCNGDTLQLGPLVLQVVLGPETGEELDTTDTAMRATDETTVHSPDSLS
jgi:pSer/pThr/pTyr-binding forkhead associated (FHA) protein